MNLTKFKPFLLLIQLFILTNFLTAAPKSLDDAIKDIHNQIVLNLNSAGKKKVAVMDFKDISGSSSKFGKYIAKELIGQIQSNKMLQVIDQLKAKEAAESVSDDPMSSNKKKVVVDAFVNGTITDKGKSVKLNVEMTLTNGEVFATASVDVAKDEEVIALLGQVKQETDQAEVTESKPVKQIKKEEPKEEPKKDNSDETKRIPQMDTGYFLNEEFNGKLDDEWQILSGSWTIVDKELTQNSTDCFALLARDFKEFKNFTMEFDFKLNDGNDGICIGFGEAETNKNVLLLQFGNAGNTQFYCYAYNNIKDDQGNYTSLDKTRDDCKIELDKNYHIKIVFTSDNKNMRVYVNNRHLKDVSDPEFKRMVKSRIFIGAYYDRISIDNIKIYRNK